MDDCDSAYVPVLRWGAPCFILATSLAFLLVHINSLDINSLDEDNNARIIVGA